MIVVFEIRYKYPGQPWETIDEADSEEEARMLLAEYRSAFRNEGQLTIRKVRN